MNSALLKKKKRKFKRLVDQRNFFEIFRRLISYNLPKSLTYLGGSDLLLLETNDLQIKREPKNCIFRLALNEDLDEILLLVDEPPRPVREKLFKEYMNDGHECYVLVVDTQIVGYLWVFIDFYSMTYDDYVNTLIQITYSKESVCLGDAFINPLYRLRGLYPFLMKEMTKTMNKRGIRKFYAFVGSHNEHSLKSHRGVGFRDYMTFRFFTFLNVNLLSIYKQTHVKKHLRIGRKSFFKSVTCDIDRLP